MRQKSVSPKEPAEKVVLDIRRRTRKQHSAEEKIRITAALMEVRHPVEPMSRELERLTELPDDWADQRCLFN